MGPVTLKSASEDIRSELSLMIEGLQVWADERPDSGAEITLAIRHLQDARMRLGVSLAIEDGKDPWKS